MNYIEVSFRISPANPWADLLAAELGEIGFESFSNVPTGLLAYIPEADFNEQAIQQVDTLNNDLVNVTFKHSIYEGENWNEKWESEFDPILVQDKVAIVASFHEPPVVETVIHIDPKMSFGTGHHATTYVMIQHMMDIDFSNKRVLDMGSGTAVLAIYAALKGASEALAVDNNEWAFDNSVDNVTANGVASVVELKHGECEQAEGRTFDVVVANINRNIILEHLPFYSSVLAKGGTLVTSGFFEEDAEHVKKKALENGLEYQSAIVRDNWIGLVFTKK